MELTFEFYDGTQYTEQIANMMADAYTYNNPFIKPLKITRQQMYEEFMFQLKTKVYRWTWVFFNKEKYDKGEKDIVGCFSWGDSVDFLPKGEYAKVTDFALVPTQTQVRTYMRHRSLQQFFAKYKPKEGEIAYGSAFGIMPKYMGTKNLSYRMFRTTLLYLQEKGYKYGSGHAINEAAKNVFRKADIVDHYNVFVADTFVLDTKFYPFEGLGLSQEVYVGVVDSSITKLQQLIDSGNRPRL